METGRSTCWESTHLSSEPPNRSNICRDLSGKGAFYSESLSGGSILPPSVGGDVKSRRSERYRRTGKTERVLKPSKHGYHRHGNTPTYKLLKEVCEKLQVLVERKVSQSVPEVDEQTVSKECVFEKEVDGLQTKEAVRSHSSSCDSGITLDLTDYSTNLSSSESVFLTPLPEDQLECVYKSQPPTQIHLYLPKMSDIPEADDTCPIVSAPATITGDQSCEKNHHRDLTYFHDSFMNRHMQRTKSSSTKCPKSKAKGSNPKIRTKKVQLSRSKRSEKSSLVSKGVKSVPQKCDVKYDSENRTETPVSVDFLCDVTTLISKEKEIQMSCAFSELSLTDVSDCKDGTKNDYCKFNKNNDNESIVPDVNNEQILKMNPSSWCYNTLNVLNKERFVDCSTCSIINGCGDNFASRFIHGLNLKETANLITTTAQ